MLNTVFSLLALLITSGSFGIPDPDYQVSKYNVVWDSPSANSLGSMPIGNGDIGVNAWVEESGDLVFYLSKTDAWSGNGRLLKLGKIRVALSPELVSDRTFRQELQLDRGTINLVSQSEDQEAAINLWVDAHHPVVNIDIESTDAIDARVSVELWRLNDRKMERSQEKHSAYGLHDLPEITVEKDSVLAVSSGLAWVHKNNHSLWEGNMELQALEEWTNSHEDPLLNRVFGGVVRSAEMKKINRTALETINPAKSINLRVYALTETNTTIDQWQESIESEISKISSISTEQRYSKHRRWWQSFWNRSYLEITATDSVQAEQAKVVNQGYILQRYINACSGRGNFPIKFNGSIFTVDTENITGNESGFDADYRRWGGPYWWQNTRLAYWPMLVSGDFDLMKPFFRLYFENLPLRKYATQQYYGHEGAFYPETMTFWGTYAGANYGRERTGKPDGLTDNTYIRRYWQGGLEMSLMMLDYYRFTGDVAFARDTLAPFVSEIIRFFDQHWSTGSDGRILFDPAQSLETYQQAVNPLPEIVGIQKVATAALQVSEDVFSALEKKLFREVLDKLPELPTETKGGELVLAPAHQYGEQSNQENPELYAIFPYRRYFITQPDVDIAIRSYNNREHKGTGGWQQTAIQAAMLGLTQDAKSLVIENFATGNEEYRFPAMWGPNFDWTPDQDHGSVAINALQNMLLQYDGDQTLLFPAWPKEWNVKFKLRTIGNRTISGEYRDEELVHLEVSPIGKNKNIVLLNPE